MMESVKMTAATLNSSDNVERVIVEGTEFNEPQNLLFAVFALSHRRLSSLLREPRWP